MRFARLFHLLAVCSVLALGCGGTVSPLPAANQVSEIRLRVANFPMGVDRKAPFEVTLTRPDDIAEIMGWLESVNWSQIGIDLTAAKTPVPDGTISVTTKAGETSDFGFFWNGNLIDTRANRFLKGADADRLRRIVLRLSE